MKKNKNETGRRSVWISDELWEKINKAAAADKRTASAWLRMAAETVISGVTGVTR